MKTKRIILVLALVLVSAFTLLFSTACGGEGDSTSTKLSGISVSTNPTKMAYVEGDFFDSSGMGLKANYSDGTSIDVTGYAWTDKQLEQSDTVITISYQGKTTDIAITVAQSSTAATFTGASMTMMLRSGGYLSVTGGSSQTGKWGNSGKTIIMDIGGQTYTVAPEADGSYAFNFGGVALTAPSATLTTSILFSGPVSINGSVLGTSTATLAENGSVTMKVYSGTQPTGEWYKSGGYIKIVIAEKEYIPTLSNGKYYFEYSAPMSIYIQLCQLSYTPA